MKVSFISRYGSQTTDYVADLLGVEDAGRVLGEDGVEVVGHLRDAVPLG